MYCMCTHPEDLSAEQEGLSSMWNARKGHPFPTAALPHSANLSSPSGECVSLPPACPLPPLLQVPPPWSNLLHDCPQEQPWCMVLSGMSFPCSLDSSRAKQCSNRSIYVLGIYTQDLNKVYIFYLTKTGVRMPGKKSVMVRVLEKDHNTSHCKQKC